MYVSHCSKDSPFVYPKECCYNRTGLCTWHHNVNTMQHSPVILNLPMFQEQMSTRLSQFDGFVDWHCFLCHLKELSLQQSWLETFPDSDQLDHITNQHLSDEEGRLCHWPEIRFLKSEHFCMKMEQQTQQCKWNPAGTYSMDSQTMGCRLLKN